MTNPLLARPWPTPFDLPPFESLIPAHYPPAFDAALAEANAEIRRIADNPAPPTFDNTITALEKSGQLRARVAEVFFNLASAHTNPDIEAIERDIAPKLAVHYTAIMLDPALFARIDALYAQREALSLTDEQKRVLELQHLWFTREGAKLDAAGRARMAEINTRLAELGTRFSQNVLADERAWHLVLDGERDLAGLPDAWRVGAARAAEEMGHPGKHVVTLARSSVEGFLQFSARRDLREEAYKAWTARGDRAGATDNRGLLAEMVALRAEQARLLGYATYADYSLAPTMAKTPANVRGLLSAVWEKGVAQAARERGALAALARAEGGNFAIEAWDWRYFAEKERRARFDLDDAEVRPYLALDAMIAAMFDVARRLFGLSFRELADAPRYHPDVRVWEVTGSAGEHVGVFIGDFFARPSKHSGGWMSLYRSQHKLDGVVRPVIVNVLCFMRGAGDGPTLLSFDDARTLFHEFGHGLHGLLSDVTYPSISCTNVVRDFVELPSQLYEHWIMTPEVLRTFARHHVTGEPMPDRLITRLKAARTFNQGFSTVEYVSSAYVDMALHALETADGVDVSEVERETLARLGMPREIGMRHRPPHFGHIVGGYAAGYYSYLWSEVMDSDAFAAFVEAGDVFAPDVAARLKTHIYSAGNRRDPHDAYVAFRGRPPAVESLMKQRGFA